MPQPLPRRDDSDDDLRPRRRRQSSGVPVWVWVLIGVGAFGTLACCGGFAVVIIRQKNRPGELIVEAQPTDGNTSSPNDPLKRIRQYEIVEAYRSNAIKADADYLNREMEVIVRIEEILNQPDGAKVTAFRYGTNTETMICFLFANADKAALANLGHGQTVLLRGTCAGRVADGVFRASAGNEFHVDFRHCSFIQAMQPNDMSPPVQDGRKRSDPEPAKPPTKAKKR